MIEQVVVNAHVKVGFQVEPPGPVFQFDDPDGFCRCQVVQIPHPRDLLRPGGHPADMKHVGQALRDEVCATVLPDRRGTADANRQLRQGFVS
ncbi:MAG: hypothetical protein ABSF60_03990 [Verrucomicrobiota bacterium]